MLALYSLLVLGTKVPGGWGWSSKGLLLESLILKIVLFFLDQYYRGFTRNCCPMLDNFMQIVKEYIL